jgi:phospholipid/cholesterol/gamma-HCH transport system substrate-binding protein
MYATLDPGGPPAARLRNGGVIPITQTDRAIQPNELLDKLDTRTRFGLTSLLNEADVALADHPEALGNGLGATRDAMTSFKPVLDQLQQRRENIRRLVTAFSGIAKGVGRDRTRLVDLTESTQQALGALASHDDQLAATLDQLPGFTSNLRSSMTSVDDLTGQLDPTLRSLTKASNDLPGALDDLTGTVGAIHRFVHGAAPVVDRAGPVLTDARPLVGNLDPALRSLRPVAGYLPAATQRLVPWMDDLGAFVYQTSSSFSLYDANGGLGRANLNVDLNNPSGALQDEGIPGHGGKR